MAAPDLTREDLRSALKYMDEVAIPAAEEALTTAEALVAATNGAAARARAESLQARLVGLRIRRMAIARNHAGA